jgi:hypothetical protein
LAAGCQVISYDRGCIATQVKDDGLVIPRDRDFVAAAMDWLVLAIGLALSEAASSPDMLHAMRGRGALSMACSGQHRTSACHHAPTE